MILDERTEFADAVTVAAAAGTALIGDVLDLGAITGLDVGVGEDIYVVLQTTTDVITAGAAGAVQFYVVSDSLATLGAGVLASCTQHAASASFVTGATAAGGIAAGGTIIAVKLPVGTYERYLGVLCTTTTTTTTAGAINAFLTKDFAKNVIYPDAL